MNNASALLRSLIVYGVCLPLAVFLGYLLASPIDLATAVIIGILAFTLMLPLFLRFHHAWLITTWNTSAILGFLPGHPPLWMGLTAVSLIIAVLQYALKREKNFIPIASVLWPLVLLGIVVVVTADFTGGIGLRSFGGEVYGGKRYFSILLAIAGYFAITSRQVPPDRAVLYVTLFFLGGAMQAIGSLAGSIHPAFSFLFIIFPVENLSDLSTQFVGGTNLIMRSGGLNTVGMALFCVLLARYGLANLFSFRNPFKLLLMLAAIFIGLLGGYRSLLIQFLMIFGLLFWLEGLHRSRLLPILALASILGLALVSVFATRLPTSIQRTMAFLPIDIDPDVKMDAQYSSEWRISMWKDVIPEIPTYLFLGKGYAMSGRETDVAQMNQRRSFEVSELAGDYHNGPLSVILPLGIFGVATFVWFLLSGLRVIYRNYKFGDSVFPTHQHFSVRVIFAEGDLLHDDLRVALC